jgi:PDZ domain/Aspartyl protease
MTSLVRISLALLIVVTTGASARAAGPTVDDVLAQCRVASGGAAVDRMISTHLSGSVAIAGIKGRFEQWSSAQSGAVAETTDAGFFSGSSGFDGADAWNQDASGFVWVDGGKAGRYAAIQQAYVANDDFLRPARRGTVSLAGQQTDHGSTYDVVQATPANGLPIQIWLDATTHLPARIVATIGVETSTTTLSDYRSVAGLRVAYRVRTTTDTGNEFDATIDSVKVNPADAARHLTKPASHATDYSIAGGDSTTVPIELVDNHVYLSVMINGKGPFHFAFDTGGSNVLDSGVAQAIGLSSSGSLQGGGVGAQTEAFSFAKVSTLGVGGASLTDQYFAVLPVRQGFSVAAGVPIDGLIGFEVLSRFITTFDYGHLSVTLRLPSAAAPNLAGADVVPFVFNNTIPQVACQLNGIPGDCSVDTGSRASVSVLTPFIAAHPSLVPADATAGGVNGFGVGGPSLGRLGRLGSLQIDTTTLDALIADFSVQQKGFFANPFIAANVGGGVWKRFAVTFNYQNRTMSLVPNADFGQRDTYDRSGLFLIQPGGKFTVLDARPNTPAGVAGLARGDVITAVNGASTDGMDLLQIRKTLSGAPGTSVRLTVQPKAGLAHDVVLVLRDYV